MSQIEHAIVIIDVLWHCGHFILNFDGETARCGRVNLSQIKKVLSNIGQYGS